MLARLQHGVAIASVGGGGVSGDEDTGRGWGLQELIDHHSAQVVVLTRNPAGELGCLHAGRQHNRITGDYPPARQFQCRRGHRIDGRAEDDLDPRVGKRALDDGARTSSQLGTDGLGTIDENDAGAFGRPIAAVAANSIAQLER